MSSREKSTKSSSSTAVGGCRKKSCRAFGSALCPSKFLVSIKNKDMSHLLFIQLCSYCSLTIVQGETDLPPVSHSPHATGGCHGHIRLRQRYACQFYANMRLSHISHTAAFFRIFQQSVHVAIFPHKLEFSTAI